MTKHPYMVCFDNPDEASGSTLYLVAAERPVDAFVAAELKRCKERGATSLARISRNVVKQLDDKEFLAVVMECINAKFYHQENPVPYWPHIAMSAVEIPHGFQHMPPHQMTHLWFVVSADAMNATEEAFAEMQEGIESGDIWCPGIYGQPARRGATLELEFADLISVAAEVLGRDVSEFVTGWERIKNMPVNLISQDRLALIDHRIQRDDNGTYEPNEGWPAVEESRKYWEELNA